MTALWSLAIGRMENVLREFPAHTFDACLCDPPYGFRFMGKSWDYDVPSAAQWAEVLRVLKPGAPLVAFGGARTYHRLACGVEDAGFEMRDCLMWLYGKGFPKSQNISLALDKAAGATRPVVGSRVLTGNAAVSLKDKGGTYGVQVGTVPPKEIPVTAPATELALQWDGYGTALKPGHEPIVLARRPLVGTMVENVHAWGVGGLDIDACRIEWQGKASGWSKTGSGASENVAMSGANYAREAKPDADGRWPANLLLSHSEECRPTGCFVEVKNGTAVKHNGVTGQGAVFAGTGIGIHAPGTPDAGYGTQQVEVWDCAPDCPVRLLDEQAGVTRSVPYRANETAGAVLPLTKRTAGGYADAGGPSRFFYCAKVSTKEREAGCEGLALRSAGEVTERSDSCPECRGAGFNVQREPCEACGASGVVRTAGLENPRAGAGRTGGARNHHPTLKPLALTQWLATLIKPPTAGAILVPFAGAGSEMIGCLLAGWGAVFGIEADAAYAEIARARLAHWCREAREAT